MLSLEDLHWQPNHLAHAASLWPAEIASPVSDKLSLPHDLAVINGLEVSIRGFLHQPVDTFPCRVREKTPPEVKEQRERERELKELDRDTRTVFAYNLNLKAEERDLFEFFSKAGKVVDVKIIMDRNTRKSKGFSYIEFQNRVCVCSSSQAKIACSQAATGAHRGIFNSGLQPSWM